MGCNDFLRSHGICVVCGKAKAAPGRVSCWDCLEKNRIAMASRRAHMTEQQRREKNKKTREYYQIRREKRIKAGMCTICGKKKAYRDKTVCYECFLRKKKQNRAWKEAHKKIAAEGMCERCKESPATRKNRWCEQCYQKMVKSAEIMREKGGVSRSSRKSIDVIWRNKMQYEI